MNSDDLTQLLYQGFRVTLGATASLVETLQDPQKRTDNFSQIASELSQRVNELAEKGEITEQEARIFVSNLSHQLTNQRSTAPASSTVSTTTTQVAPPDIQLELQELTAQIAAMRAEIEKLRDSDANPS